MAKYIVANSGSRDHIPGQTGRFVLEIEDRGISEELHSDEQGADRRFSFTDSIYSYLRYQQYKVAASAPGLEVELG